MSEKILITGATGHNGSEIIHRLSAADIDARAMTRNPTNAPQLDGIEWVAGSFDNDAPLATAMQDFDNVFVVLPVSPNIVNWVNNVISAAHKTGVRHIVKLSGFGVSTDSPSEIIRLHGQSDAHIRDSGLNWTLLQPNSFFQNILGSIDTIRDQNRFYLPMKDGSQSMIDVREISLTSLSLFSPAKAMKTRPIACPDPRH